jgi:hypothetical protein
MSAQYNYTKVVEVFLSRVYPEPNTGCWLWGGAVNSGNYGSFIIKEPRFFLAHRFSYFHFNGDFNRRLCVLHRCDNTFCVNPDHLFLGTQLDNITDRHNKGRNNKPKGVLNKKAKLSETDVLQIRSLPNPAGEVSKMFSISKELVWKIRAKRLWNHI